GRLTDPDPENRPHGAAAALEELAEIRPAAKADKPEKPAGRVPTHPSEPPCLVEDDILPDDGSIPRPIFHALLAMLFVVGVAGSATFFFLEMALAPFGFAVARAFVAPPRRPALRGKEQDVRKSLRGARDGFRALASRGSHALRLRRLLPR